MSRRYDLVLFDLDGTLTASHPGVINSIRTVLEKMGKPIPADEVICRFIGPPMQWSFPHLCNFSEEETMRGIELFREVYNTKGIYENSCYPHILELLAALKKNGIKVCVATSKPQSAAEIVVGHFGILEYTDFISGASEDERSHSKSDLIRKGMEACGVPAGRSVMIGDTRFDVQGAVGAGIDCIGVLYGYGSREEMEEAGCSVFVKDVPELQKLLLGDVS